MSEETPEIEPTEEKPKRPRRRRKASEDTPPSAPARQAADEQSEADQTRVAADADAASEAEAAAEPSADVAPQAEEEPGGEAAEPDDAEPEAAEPVPADLETAEPKEKAKAPARPRPRRTRSPAPTPAPRRGRRRRELPDVVVRAQAKYVRSSARKARLVCDHIRGKTVEEARAILAHTPRAVARDWSKLLESAVANAEHNHELIGEDLYIKAVRADEGPTIKRYRPRALGRATRIRKRTSHLTILLTPKRQ